MAAIAIFLFLSISPTLSEAGLDEKSPADPDKRFQTLIDNGAYGLERNGKLLVSYNLDLPLIPASVIKILTGLVAVEKLGPDYRFKTDFFLDKKDNLFIKGYGDPYLISEEVEQIMFFLKKSGVRIIKDIYLDSSVFQLKTNADGTASSLNPYDVASSALAVNFNTINIVVDESGIVLSGEPQTPLLPIMNRLGRNLPQGLHRINVSRNYSDSLLLAGQLFRSFQKKAGIGGNGEIRRGVMPNRKPFHIHYSSKNLSEILKGLMLYSNNYIANQIFLKIGAESFGYPATWDKGKKALRDFIAKDRVLKTTKITIEEGSGISRQNRLTVRAMLRILELFKPYADLLPEENGNLIKSGTLTGVYSYAGYLHESGERHSFAIILNQSKNSRDEILRILQKIHQ